MFFADLDLEREVVYQTESVQFFQVSDEEIVNDSPVGQLLGIFMKIALFAIQTQFRRADKLKVDEQISVLFLNICLNMIEYKLTMSNLEVKFE